MHDSAAAKNSKTVLITGASGVVGRHLRKHAAQHNWNVRALTTSIASKRDDDTTQWVGWNPELAANGDTDAIAIIAEALTGAAVIINLAGSAVDAGRVGPKHRQRILTSRLHASEALAAALRTTNDPPTLWIQASAVGYYGDTGEKEVTEQDPLGTGLHLSDICRQWEAAGLEAEPSIRRIVTRIGLVMASDAEAYKKMMQPIRMGVGGRLGNGKQWYPWIAGQDIARAFFHLIDMETTADVYNFTAPEPVRQFEMTQLLAKAINRPSFFPAPNFVLKAVLGGVASELLLPSCRALPANLLASGFQFRYRSFADLVPDLIQGE